MSDESKANGGFDLAQFDSIQGLQEEGIDVAIKGPDGKTDLGFSIRVAGPDSTRQKAAILKLRDERLESDDITPLSSEQITERQLRGLAMSIISWTPFKLDGVEPRFSEGAAMKLFKRFPWIREQVETKAGSRLAFLKPSKPDASEQLSAGSEG